MFKYILASCYNNSDDPQRRALLIQITEGDYIKIKIAQTAMKDSEGAFDAIIIRSESPNYIPFAYSEISELMCGFPECAGFNLIIDQKNIARYVFISKISQSSLDYLEGLEETGTGYIFIKVSKNGIQFEFEDNYGFFNETTSIPLKKLAELPK
jgi:hypothetical protein